MTQEPLDLDDLLLSVTGNPRARTQTHKKEIFAAPGRDLEVADLVKANEPNSIKVLDLQKLRRSHHELARYCSQGLKHSEISLLTGYSPQRIAQLVNHDPAFQQLMEHYREIEDDSYIRSRSDFHARLASLGFDSIEILHERLLENPEEITTAELLKITEAAADRTGHGKTATVNHNVKTLTLTPKDLADIREQESARETAELASPNREALLRLAVRATDPSQAGTEEGGESSRAELREEGDEGAEAEAQQSD